MLTDAGSSITKQVEPPRWPTVRCPGCLRSWLAAGVRRGDTYTCKACGRQFVVGRHEVTGAGFSPRLSISKAGEFRRMMSAIDVYAVPRAAIPACEPEDRGPASSDLTLASRAGSGDMPALGELYRRYNRRVYSLCLRMTANTAEAEDLTQEVFIKLFHEAGTFRGESAFTTWLHRLTVNVVLMYLRKHKRRFERPTQDMEIPDQPVPGTERPDSVPALDRVRLDRALAELPPGYRVVFVLFDVEGYTHDEIALILGCSPGTSKSQLHKARTRLRALLRGRPPGRANGKGEPSTSRHHSDRYRGPRTSFSVNHSSLLYGKGRGHD